MQIRSVKFALTNQVISVGDGIRFVQKGVTQKDNVIGFECSAHDPTSVSVVITEAGAKVYESEIAWIFNRDLV